MLNRRIEKVDAIAGKTIRYYYDDHPLSSRLLRTGRIVMEERTSQGSTAYRWFVYGNYIDEVLVMSVIPAQAGIQDYYYANDHLYSTVALFEDDGGIDERYEYDAYGAVKILNSNFEIRASSLYDNTYYFTGRELDTLDAGNCTLMYYRAIIKWVIYENIFVSQNRANTMPNTIVPDTFNSRFTPVYEYKCRCKC